MLLVLAFVLALHRDWLLLLLHLRLLLYCCHRLPLRLRCCQALQELLASQLARCHWQGGPQAGPAQPPAQAQAETVVRRQLSARERRLLMLSLMLML